MLYKICKGLYNVFNNRFNYCLSRRMRQNGGLHESV